MYALRAVVCATDIRASSSVISAYFSALDPTLLKGAFLRQNKDFGFIFLQWMYLIIASFPH